MTCFEASVAVGAQRRELLDKVMGPMTPRPSAIKKDAKKVEISAKREGSPKDDGTSPKKAEARAGRRSITIQRPAPVQIESPEPPEPSAAETPTLASTPRKQESNLMDRLGGLFGGRKASVATPRGETIAAAPMTRPGRTPSYFDELTAKGVPVD